MSPTKKSFDLLSNKQREVAVKKIIDYFATEQDLDLGIIADEEVLDIFLASAGLTLFNQGVNQTKELVNNRLQQLGFEIDLLIKDS